MKYDLFEDIIVTNDIPEKNLKKGDVATIVDKHPVSDGEAGYSLEIFNAPGDTISVITVPESYIEQLSHDEILSARSLVAA